MLLFWIEETIFFNIGFNMEWWGRTNPEYFIYRYDKVMRVKGGVKTNFCLEVSIHANFIFSHF